MTSEEINAELDRIMTGQQQRDAELRSKIGEEAFATLQIERTAEAARRDEYLRTIVIQPEWMQYGFDLRTLSNDEFQAVLLAEETALQAAEQK